MHLSFKLTAVATLVTLSGFALAQEQVVKIGHVGPVSGAIAHLGKDNENGARLAVEELNAEGVMIDGKKAELPNTINEYDFGALAKQERNARARLRLIGLAHLKDGNSIDLLRNLKFLA
mgnify:CR=1 FL=1